MVSEPPTAKKRPRRRWYHALTKPCHKGGISPPPTPRASIHAEKPAIERAPSAQHVEPAIEPTIEPAPIRIPSPIPSPIAPSPIAPGPIPSPVPSPVRASSSSGTSQSGDTQVTSADEPDVCQPPRPASPRPASPRPISPKQISRPASPRPTSRPTSGPTSRPASPKLASPRASSCRVSAWRELRATIQGFKDSKLFPPLFPVIDGLISFLGTFEAAIRHRHDYLQLAEHLDVTLCFLKGHLDSHSTVATDTITDIIHVLQKQLESHNDSDEQALVGSFRRIEQLFHRLQASFPAAHATQVVSRLFYTRRAYSYLGQQTRLEKLNPVKEAAFNSLSSRTCTKHTRETILSDLNAWSDDPDAEQIFWLDGAAGTGKTTVAYTLSQALESRGQLAASFFCSRTSPGCRDPKRIVPTIAYQLARHSTPFCSSLGRALDRNPGAASLEVPLQFEKLFKDPLLQVKDKLPNNMVVVIDGLDECQGDTASLLDMMTRKLPIKFFVTGRRPDSHAVGRRCEIGGRADVELYLREELVTCSDHVEQLAHLAGDLFIYAATAVRYIRPGDTAVDTNERLKTLLSTKPKSINMLYSTILGAVLDDPNLEPSVRDCRRLALWTAVCAREPVSVKTLAALAGLETEQAREALQPLESVLAIGSSISVLHVSLGEYMITQDPTPHTHNQLLARRCFEIIKDQARFNICHFESSFVCDRDVPDLGSRIEKNVSPELGYACRYWAEHLKSASPTSELVSMLEEFLSERLLFWMEVVNLDESLVAGAFGLVEIRTWLSMHNGSPRLVELTTDAHKFVAGFAAQAISLSTPHIYISALALTPKSSTVWRNYGKRMQGLVELTGPAMDQIKLAPLATWETGSFVTSVGFSADGARIVAGSHGGAIRVLNVYDGAVAVGPWQAQGRGTTWAVFSPDGARIASVSSGGGIQMWDAQSGVAVGGELSGHTQPVHSIAFFPDGARIVSGSGDETVRVWSGDGTCVLGPLKGHTGAVYSVAVSFDGARIGSAGQDRTIRLWNAQDGSSEGLFEGHTDSVHSIAFSPDETRIVSGSGDKTVRVWSVNGALVIDPIRGHTGGVKSVAFSPDGGRIVSGSDDKTVQVWNADDGVLVAGPFRHTSFIYSVAFSPDGVCVVSGSNDKTIRMWNTLDGTLDLDPFQGCTSSIKSVALSSDGSRVACGCDDKMVWVWNASRGALVAPPFQGHTSAVTLVVFSPDDGLVASTSKDKTIRVWAAHNGTSALGPLKGHTGEITSIAFSPDGARIVSGSQDKKIGIWNVQDGTLLAGFLEGHTGHVRSVTFSPDGARIVSGAKDGMIRMWNAHDGALVADSFRGHWLLVQVVAFSPDGARIAAASAHELRVWNVADGSLVAGPSEGGHTKSIQAVAFSSSGERIVSVSEDQTICLWSACDGKLVARLVLGDAPSAYPAAFSFNGAYIVSYSNDRVIRVWNVEQLVGSISQDGVQVALDQSWEVRPDGWISNAKGELLFYPPASIRDQFPRPSNLYTVHSSGFLHVARHASLLDIVDH
ncbi:Vegetative incompatibility protein HET-E-1 [Ceratobasidium theobromae]|uniref:Vegetative incompatibility protein HET-E-1 n=1 Tax=Ceratobasidium theobromae TaxID=1582974 RepID=A0A5N5QJZ0_9AGAM|nr:Vegetative incompatibility protein HET-E-1 [Ceratobasidium theobromae]